jgi:hypothetical protein
MVSFDGLLKGFQSNFSASIAAVMVLAIFGLSGYIVQLHSERAKDSAAMLDAQVKCSEEVLKCEQFWRERMEEVRRQELEKTQQQVNELNQLLKQMKKI